MESVSLAYDTICVIYPYAKDNDIPKYNQELTSIPSTMVIDNVLTCVVQHFVYTYTDTRSKH